MHFAQRVLRKGHFALNRKGINSQRAQVCATFYICTFMYSLQLSLQYICRINQHIPWRAPAGVLFYTESAFTLLLGLELEIYIFAGTTNKSIGMLWMHCTNCTSIYLHQRPTSLSKGSMFCFVSAFASKLYIYMLVRKTN